MTEEEHSDTARRRFLQLASGVTAMTLAGCGYDAGTTTNVTATRNEGALANDGNQTDRDSGSETLPSRLTVKMTTASDGSYLFDPGVSRIRVGGTVKWAVMSGVHTATAYHPDSGKPLRIPDGAQPWDSGLLHAGDSFERTFDTEGIFHYYCMPHEGNGMVGTLVVGHPTGSDQPALAPPQEELPTEARTAMEASIERTKEMLGTTKYLDTAEVTVESTDDGSYAFHPEIVRVRNGGIVRWRVANGAHTATAYHTGNGKPQRVPDGTPAWNSGLLSDGQSFEQRFTDQGVYDYFCMPHESQGMIGSIIVGDPDRETQPGLAAPQDVLTEAAGRQISRLNDRVTKILDGEATPEPSPTPRTETPDGDDGEDPPPSTTNVSMRITADGSFTFDADLVFVDPGDTVRWTLKKGTHTATAYHPKNDKPRRIPAGAASFDSGMLSKDGATFEHTFETPGVYDYFCLPHESMGMVGRVVVGAPDLAAEPGMQQPQASLPARTREAIRDLNQRVQKKASRVTQTASPTPTLTQTPTETPGGGSGATTATERVVSYAFEPEVVHVSPGDTVTWTIEEGVHSVTAYHPTNDRPSRLPGGASSFDSGLMQAGDTFSHTFDTAGVHDYFCLPHESMGMVGSVIVGTPDPATDPGLQSPQSSLPPKARDELARLNELARAELGGGGGEATPTGSTGTSAPTPSATPTPPPPSTPASTSTPASGGGSMESVSIPGERFSPNLVHIQPGDAVEWTWNEGGHTVSAYHPGNNRPQRIPDGAAPFDSGLGDQGNTFTHRFDTEGVYDYFCMPHESKPMVGSVIVGTPDPGADPGLQPPQSSLPAEVRAAISDLNQRATAELDGSGGQQGDGGQTDGGGSDGGLRVCGSYEMRNTGAISFAFDGEVCPGATLGATATLDGSGVSGAEIAVNGDTVGTTGPDGAITVTVPDDDRFRIEAETADAEGELRIDWAS